MRLPQERQNLRMGKKVPYSLFLLLCLNVMMAPALHAATGKNFSHGQSYALGILMLVTLSLSAYLFVVMFQPERF